MAAMRALILPALGYLGYPMAVAGGLLVFGTCSLLTLDMVARNMGQVVAPASLSPDFNVPAVEQIGSIEPPAPARGGSRAGCRVRRRAGSAARAAWPRTSPAEPTG
jgi:hypothetical protein